MPASTRRRQDDVLPHDDEAEEALVACALLDPAVADAALEVARPCDLWSPRLRAVYARVEARRREGEPAEARLILADLRAAGDTTGAADPAWLSELLEGQASAANAVAYAHVARRLALRRELLRLGEGLAAEARDDGCDPVAVSARWVESLSRLEVVRQRTGLEVDDVAASDVTPRAVAWLWPPYLPVGKIALLQGDASAGKTWLCLAIAAILSRGWRWPDEPLETPAREPSGSCYLSREDDVEDTLRPRLDGLGADCSRIWIASRARLGLHPADLGLRDLDALRAWLERRRPALLVVDPVQSFLGADVDAHHAEQVRPILDGLAMLAREAGVAILIVRHLAKAPTSRAIHSGMGSQDFTSAARSVLLAGTPPGQDDRRCVAHIKSTCAARGPGWGYVLERDQVTFTRETCAASTLLAPERAPGDGRGSETEAWLLQALAQGPRDARSVHEAAVAEGLAEHTLDRAKRRLGVVSERPGGCGPWRWRLPQAGATA